MMFWMDLVFWCALGAAGAFAFRLLPAVWLCDYGETPGEAQAAVHRRLRWWQIAALGLLCGACTALLMLQCGPVFRTLRGTLGGLLAALFFSALLLAAVCDARYGILPDELLALAAAGAAGAWACGCFVHFAQWYAPFLGMAAGFFGLWAVQLLASKLYHTEAMGFGDVKLLGVCGFACGLGGLGVAVLLAVLAAALTFAVLLALKKAHRRDAFPFGPFLIGGTLFALCLRPLWLAALAWYLGRF